MTDRLITLLVLFALLLVACDQTAGDGERVITPAAISQTDPTNTPLPSPIPTDTPAPTVTPLPATDVPTPTEEPTATATPEPTATIEGVPELNEDSTVIRITVASANLRAGPGLSFDTVGVVLFNDAFVVVEQDETGLWYLVQLNDGTTGWVTASVTEEVSPEVFAALISTPDAAEEAAATSEPEEVGPTPTPSPTPLLAQVVFPSVNLRNGPGLEFDIIGFVFEDDVYRVEEQDDTGFWLRVTLNDGTSGWIAASTTTLGIDSVVTNDEDGATGEVATSNTAGNRGFGTTTQENAAAGFATVVASDPSLIPSGNTVNTGSTSSSTTANNTTPSSNTNTTGNTGATANVDTGSNVDTTTSTDSTTTTDVPISDDSTISLPIPATDGAVVSGVTDLPGANNGGIIPSGSRVPVTNIGGAGDDNPQTPLYPGSNLYYDENNSGYGAGIAIAPSGPDPIILREDPTKSDVSAGHQPSRDFLPGKPRIMLIGDGITSGTRVMSNGYRRSLYNMIKDGGHWFDFVGTMNTHTNPQDYDSDHEGHVNYRADQVLAGLSRWAGLYPPDVVVIHIGTNDLLQGQSVESTIQDVQLIIQTIRYHNPNVKVILSHIIPTTDSWVNGLINKYNAQLNGISWSQNTGNSPIYVVSQHKNFRAELDTYDGIHPNAQGADKIARNIYQTLNRLFLVSK